MEGLMSLRYPVIILSVFLLFTQAKSVDARSMITGKVVDAETGKPIEGAAVFIEWMKKTSGPPGLASYELIEKMETLTVDDGTFKIPKYSTWFNDYTLLVYKKNYVCWSNKNIFPSCKRRDNFSLKNKVVIKLDKFNKSFSKEMHAKFTVLSGSGIKGGGIFHNAIREELALFGKMIRRNGGTR